jgi:hypothetical protein
MDDSDLTDVQRLEKSIYLLKARANEAELRECNLRDRIRTLESLLLLRHFHSMTVENKRGELLKIFKDSLTNNYRLAAKTTDVFPYLKVELEKAP